jgi:flagellar hook-associated protein 1 FlgK
VFTQITNALSTTGIVSSNPSGTTLRLVDDGAGGRVSVTAASVTKTITSLQSGDSQMPLFLDGNGVYSGSFSSAGVQSQGFASRISVNGAVLADPSKLVIYGAGTPNGDASRPNFILDQLLSANLTFNPNSGIGTATAPFSGTLSNFLQQVVEHQGQAASNASTLKEGQDVVLASLQQRFTDESGVNIDTEMAHLLDLQNAYAANARVMSTIKSMLDMLMQM